MRNILSQSTIPSVIRFLSDKESEVDHCLFRRASNTCILIPWSVAQVGPIPMCC